MRERSDSASPRATCHRESYLVRIPFIIVVIRWTGLAPWEFEFPFPGSLTSTFLGGGGGEARQERIGLAPCHLPQREFFIDNLLVRIPFILVMIRWTGLAPWEFESPFPGSLTSTFLGGGGGEAREERFCLAPRHLPQRELLTTYWSESPLSS